MQIKDEKFISWAEARKILEKKTDDGELSYEQKNALEHLKKFSKMSSKKVSEIIEELKKIEMLKERHIISIVNMLPATMDDVKMLFANEMVELSDEKQKEILNVVKKFT